MIKPDFCDCHVGDSEDGEKVLVDLYTLETLIETEKSGVKRGMDWCASYLENLDIYVIEEEKLKKYVRGMLDWISMEIRTSKDEM